MRGWRRVNVAPPGLKAGSPCIPNTAKRCSRHFAGWAAQAIGSRPARLSGSEQGKLRRGGGASHHGKHACAQAAVAAEGWGWRTSARARREPAKYLEEVGGEVEKSGVEERLRGRSTVP